MSEPTHIATTGRLMIEVDDKGCVCVSQFDLPDYGQNNITSQHLELYPMEARQLAAALIEAADLASGSQQE